MYFSNFPQIVYDFNINGVVDYKVITDISKNIRFRKKVLENIALFDEYDIVEGETPEIISEKIYGTPYYHWVIMIVNERYDYINDFPLTTRELDELIETKYGDRKFHVHHYLYNDPNTGKLVRQEGSLILKLKESLSLGSTVGVINVGDVLKTVDYGYQGRVEEILIPYDGTYATIRISLREGQFFTGADAIIIPGDTTADVVSITTPSLYTTVNNFDYEQTINESKRRIKVVDPRFIDQIIKEFEDIL